MNWCLPRWIFAGKTVLDLGAGFGLKSFWAKHLGAGRTVALDEDAQSIVIGRTAAAWLGLDGLSFVHANLWTWRESGDIVFASTAGSGLVGFGRASGAVAAGPAARQAGGAALPEDRIAGMAGEGEGDGLSRPDGALRRLFELTRQILLLEVAHDSGQTMAVNTRSSFGGANDMVLSALRNHFPCAYEISGPNAAGRMYIAFKQAGTVEEVFPLPDVVDPSFLISNKNATAYSEHDTWSRLYDDNSGIIVKQATPQLFSHEVAALRRLDSDYFPRLLFFDEQNGCIAVEKVDGERLSELIDTLCSNVQDFHRFGEHCLQILALLQAACCDHGDIHMENILIRQGKPVLIDFGNSRLDGALPWNSEFLPARNACDVYAMGSILSRLSCGRYPEYKSVLGLMTSPTPSRRLTDARKLQALWRVIPLTRLDGELGADSLSSSASAHTFAVAQAARALLDCAGLCVVDPDARLKKVPLEEVDPEHVMLLQDILEKERVIERLQKRREDLQRQCQTAEMALSKIYGSRTWQVLSSLRRTWNRVCRLASGLLAGRE